MPGAAIENPIPLWLRPENASVTDTALTKAMRMIGHLIGADNPTAQVLGLMMTDVPGGAPTGGLAKAVEGLKARVIKAYHGSPHDFERFSLEKIGTGEGAQAYGHGLYFAENEDVAFDYRNRLSAQMGTLAHKGEPLKTVTSGKEWLKIPEAQYPDYAANDLLTQSYRSNQGRGYKADDYVNDAINSGKLIVHRTEGPERVYWQQVVDTIESKRKDLTVPGKMYEVAIHADPEDFLDWDKPLSQQSEKVKQALEAAGVKQRTAEEMDLLKYDYAKRFYEKPYFHLNDIEKQEVLRAVEANRVETGAAAYRKVGEATAEQSTAKLKQAGIPGIKYLDQGSRAAGEGSRNYVVFDDRLIDILKKYGLLLPAAGGAGQATISRRSE